MPRTHRRLGLLFFALGTLMGLILLFGGAPLWSYYVAPLVGIPVLVAALRTQFP